MDRFPSYVKKRPKVTVLDKDFDIVKIKCYGVEGDPLPDVLVNDVSENKNAGEVFLLVFCRWILAPERDSENRLYFQTTNFNQITLLKNGRALLEKAEK